MTPFVTVAATVLCPHGAPATIIPSNTRVMAGGGFVAVLSDVTLVAGCPLVVVLKPQPCLPVTWMMGTTRVLVGGQPALVQAASGLCNSADGIPAGPPTILPAQTRALGS